jgi:eukaryotic-like serine/threonine-protein kinase
MAGASVCFLVAEVSGCGGRGRSAGAESGVVARATSEPAAIPADRLVLGRYRLGPRLGSGGFGLVHAAFDLRLEREVAVKVLPRDGSAPERARREALAAARLEHPGIVALYDAGQEAGARFLVSELVRGTTLAELEAAGELSDRDVLRLGVTLAHALAHAHGRGVVHRDVKPQNVMVPAEGDVPAKLTDFGAAQLVGDDPLTQTGDVVGTLAYMAPEQAGGERVDARTDLYALALVLFEALAGRHPVRAPSPAATAQRIGMPLPSLAGERPDLPAELTAALDRALRVHPDDRGTMEDLAHALEAALPEVSDEGGTLAALPLEAEERTGRWERPASAAAGGLLAAAAVHVFASAPAIGPAPVGAATAIALLALPRAGWVAAAVAVALLVGAEEARSALLLLGAAAVAPVALAAAPLAWPVPAAAVVMALAGVAGAFPALAGRARDWRVRAGLGATGAAWLLLAAPLGFPELFLDLRSGVPVEAVTLTALWALAAVAVPWVIRGRHLAADLVMASGWAAALAAATGALATWMGAGEPRGLVAGAVAGGLLAVWARL